ncbi:trem-like transcript 2 protein isoform X2 [Sapajus apella]|uniref:Trem-like transcript 2 protein n=1 Tax=Sapajus apella TaxID=9515 RepID=A0A6J3FUA1_SAPAP|nr:trem-like transcript 2 protein isoform X2 [Sapajus apella]
MRLLEGETLSVLCSYKGYRNRMDGKVWCKVRRRKCEPGFTRVRVKGPRYLLQDDAQAKVVHITMAALTLQDSGRYWCMRNSSGTLYPMLGIQLDVSPGGKLVQENISQYMCHSRGQSQDSGMGASILHPG